MFLLLSTGVFSGPSVAGPLTSGPAAYIGARSADPEKETFGHVVTSQTEHLVFGFVGPAGQIGLATSDLEKDTIGYRPMFGLHRDASGTSCFDRE
jgi:hypothetical protein